MKHKICICNNKGVSFIIQLKSDIPLRYYQSDGIQAVLRFRRKRHSGLLIVLPTGTGKTILFGGLSRAVNRRTLVMAHRNELLQQALDKIRMVWPDVSVGLVRGSINQVEAQVVAGSVATLRNPKRLKSYLSAGVPDLVIIDEAHHAVSSSYRTILTAIRAANPYCTIVGVTATPNRGDGVALKAVFDRVVYQKSLWTMVRQGFLVDLVGYRITLPIPQSRWSQLRTVGGDYVDADVDRIMNVAEVNEALVDGWLERMQGAKRGSLASLNQMSTVVFCASIGHAESLEETFSRRGVPATVVHSKLKDEERARRLQAFHEGKYTVVTTVAVLTEGWDEPAIQCVMIARPTKSPALYLQMVGRGTRTFPNKLRCIVLDVTPEDVAPDVCQLGSALAGRPLPEGTSIREAMFDQVVAGDIVRDQEGLHVDSNDDDEPTAPAGIAAFDPFDKARLTWVFVEGRDGRQMRFVRTGDTAIYWVVPRLVGYPEHDDSWIVLQSRADKDDDWTYTVEGRPLLTEYALSLVDQKARSALTTRNAKWRMQAASEKQVELIKTRGGEPGPALTKGGASDWINELTKDATAAGLRRWLGTAEGHAVD